MGRGVLTLDQIWSATSTFTVRWSAGLESNKAHRVLHYLLCRLYDEGRGQLVNARLTLAQTTLSKKLGISRQWVGELVSRLERAGWVEHASQKLPDGTNGSTLWRIGCQLKRLLVMLGVPGRLTTVNPSGYGGGGARDNGGASGHSKKSHGLCSSQSRSNRSSARRVRLPRRRQGCGWSRSSPRPRPGGHPRSSRSRGSRTRSGGPSCWPAGHL